LRYEWIARGDVRVGYPPGARADAERTLDDFVLADADLQRYLEAPRPSPVTLLVAPSRAEMDRLIKTTLGYGFHKAPSRASLVAVSSKIGTVYLAPSAYAAHSSYHFNSDDFRRLVRHETVHVLTFQINARAKDAPKFWIEGLPVLWSEQYLHLDEFSQPIERALRERSVPHLDAILASGALSYAWGWTLVRFIREAYGDEMIRKLVSNGAENVWETLGDGPAAFDEKWRNWIMIRHGAQDGGSPSSRD
jgi:hypothetical protein